MGWCGRGSFAAAFFEPHDDDVKEGVRKRSKRSHPLFPGVFSLPRGLDRAPIIG